MAPVQVHVTQASGSSSPLAVTIPSTTLGNTLVLKVSTIGTTTSPTVSGVTLGGSATGWAAGPSHSNTNHGICQAWIGSSIAGSQTALSVTFTGGSGTLGIICTAEEWSGLSGTVDANGTAGATGTSLAFSSGASATLAQSNEVAFGLACTIPSSVVTLGGPGSPWVNNPQKNQTVSGNTFEQMDGSDILSANTAVTYAGSLASSNSWCALVFTVEAAAGTAYTADSALTITAGLTAAATSGVAPPSPYAGIDLRGEVNLGTWTDATAYLREGATVQITRGRQNLKSTLSPASATMTLDNRDSRWTIRNPAGAWYGSLVQNSPFRFSVPSSLAGIGCYLRNETDQASYISCPDAAGLQITSGTLSVRIDCQLSDWRQATLIGKNGATAKAWALWTNNDGTIVFEHHDGTNDHNATSTIPLPYFNGRIAIRADYNIAAQTITFYTAPAMAGAWTQLGSVTTTPATLQASGAGQSVQVGTTAQTTVSFGGMYGAVYEAQVLSTGTLVADPVFTSQTPGAASFADAQGNTWTLAGTAELSGRLYRFHGELAALPRAGDPSLRDAWSQAQGGGITRRMQQQQSPASSAMARAYLRLPANLNLAAYWPCEDAAGATQIGPAVGSHAMTNSGMTMASSTAFACSAALPVTNSASATGIVDPASVSWTDNVLRFLVDVPAAGDTSPCVIASMTTLGTVATLTLTYTNTSGGELTLTGYSAAGAVLFTMGPFAYGTGVNGNPQRVSMALRTSGSNVEYEVQTLVPGATQAIADNGTYNTATIGGVTSVSINPAGALVSTGFGHVSVQGVWDTLYDLDSASTPSGIPTGALNAWSGEPAATRVARLCSEEGYACRIIGPPLASQPMGNQTQQTIFALLTECETTDQGILFEPRQVLAIGYVTHGALCQQPPLVTADFSAAQVDQAFSPVSDDSLVVNDVTMTAADGSAYRTTLASGAMSVASPPSGAGRFDTQITVNPQFDSQLMYEAGWYLHVASADEDRYPQIPFQLARGTQPKALLLADIGSYVALDNTPSWVPPGPVKQIVAGYTETFGPQPLWALTLNGLPETPYETALIGDAVYGHLDTAGSTLHTGITSGATSWSVATTTGPLWTTSAGDFPFDWKIAGEQVTVTNITGASSPQTATVTRSVNGVVKAHLAGEAISLYHPMILAL